VVAVELGGDDDPIRVGVGQLVERFRRGELVGGGDPADWADHVGRDPPFVPLRVERLCRESLHVVDRSAAQPADPDRDEPGADVDVRRGGRRRRGGLRSVRHGEAELAGEAVHGGGLVEWHRPDLAGQVELAAG
jgi:hypothetical protein